MQIKITSIHTAHFGYAYHLICAPCTLRSVAGWVGTHAWDDAARKANKSHPGSLGLYGVHKLLAGPENKSGKFLNPKKHSNTLNNRDF